MPELNIETIHLEEDERILRYELALVKVMLLYCADKQGAKITITVEHECGNKATANLYDHAALVQGLYDALDYFETEL